MSDVAVSDECDSQFRIVARAGKKVLKFHGIVPIRLSGDSKRMTSSIEGIQRAEAQIADSAKRLSRLPAAFTSLLTSTQGAGGDPVDVVDISAETVALLQARNVAEANIAAIRTFDDIQQHLLNILN